MISQVWTYGDTDSIEDISFEPFNTANELSSDKKEAKQSIMTAKVV